MKRRKRKSKSVVCIIILVTAIIILLVGTVIAAGFIKKQRNEQKKQEAITEFRENRDVETEEEKAENGDVFAQFHIALSYGLGDGTEQNDEKAYYWMELAANQNLAEAQYLIGEMLLQGLGTDQDIDAAAEYIKKAVENGSEDAKQLYAEFAFVGEENYQDYEISYPIFLENRDIPINIYALGVMYYYGMGTDVDYNRAAVCFQQASDAGIETAGTYLAEIQKRVTDTSVSLPEMTPDAEYHSQLAECEAEYPDMAGLLETYVELLQNGEEYEPFETELDAMHQANPDVAASLTLFGKDNYLFFRNQADGQSYHDYVGDNHFSDAELEKIKNRLLEQRKKVEEKGADYVCMIVPNKEIIYAEKMPGYIERVSTTTRTDLLVEYLRKETDLDIVYCKDTFMDIKDQYPIYYHSDTHWTMVGSYMALSDLMDLRYNNKLEFDMDMFTIPTQEYPGDLSVILQREDRFNDDVYNLPKEHVSDKDCVDDKLLLIGDSFGEFLNMEAKHYFLGGVESVEIGNYGYQFMPALEDKLVNTEPDLVVVECVERYIERLAQ